MTHWGTYWGCNHKPPGAKTGRNCFSREPPEGVGSSQHLDFAALKLLLLNCKKYTCIVLSHLACGDLLRWPQGTNRRLLRGMASETTREDPRVASSGAPLEVLGTGESSETKAGRALKQQQAGHWLFSKPRGTSFKKAA